MIKSLVKTVILSMIVGVILFVSIYIGGFRIESIQSNDNLIIMVTLFIFLSTIISNIFLFLIDERKCL